MAAALALVPDANKELAAEMQRRLTRAELDFNRHSSRISDCYKFALPWRHKIGGTATNNQSDEIFDESLMTIVEDFAADMLNTFTPMKNDWVEIQPSTTLRGADQAEVKKQLQDYQGVLFAEMARSNLYQALQESYLDLSIGTMALTIQDIDPAEPIHCQAIPMTELRIDRGPWGGVDGKWRKWKVRGEDIPTLWSGARKPNGDPYKSGDMTDYDVVDGSWRDWSDRSREAHRYAVMAGSEIIYQERYEGAGSCPMIVARWSRDSTTALGVGPTYRTMPAFKTLNHVKYLLLKNIGKVVDPNVSYENDGVINMEQGFDDAGLWIPREVGSKAPEVIESKSKFDVAWLSADDLMSIIKRAHYQDRPEQLGKTPASATQWADEAAERARRMGTPATSLVHELQYPVIRRFAYLLAKRGVLPKVQLNGAEVSLTPISPLLRAQEQEEIVRMDRFAEMLGARLGPQLTPVLLDVVPWVRKLAERFGVDPTLLRDEKKIEEAIKQLLPILQNFSAGRPGEIAPPSAGAITGGV